MNFLNIYYYFIDFIDVLYLCENFKFTMMLEYFEASLF